MFNKSRTYLLPLLSHQADCDFQGSANVYLYKYGDFESYRLHVMYENVSKLKNFKQLDEFLINSYCYSNSEEVGDSVIYTFVLDDEFHADYEKFIDGKYSRFSSNAKKLILKYWNAKYSRTNKRFVIDVKNILDRSPILRKELETKLAVKIDPEQDLSSSIYIEDEIYGN